MDKYYEYEWIGKNCPIYLTDNADPGRIIA